MQLEIILPLTGFFLISFLNIYLIEIFTSPNISEIMLDYVLRPDPGGPTRITYGGLRGALFLNLIFNNLLTSYNKSFCGLSTASFSVINGPKAL